MMLCEVAVAAGASWGEDDVIFIGQFQGGLLQVSANGGVPEVATSLSLDEATSSSAFAHRDPEVLPGGAATLFTVYHGPVDSLAELAVLAADAEAPRACRLMPLASGTTLGRYSVTKIGSDERALRWG